MAEQEHGERWEQQALRDIAMAGIREQRRRRRWGIFFKLALLVYLFLLLLAFRSCQFAGEAEPSGRHTAVIHVDGPIAAGSPASAELIIRSLDRAFGNRDVAGVVLDINSPGGSPVEAGRVNDEIHRLRKAHPNVPVYAVGGDLLTSGAYYIAVAADKIYVNKASLVGSIGVLMNGFGFTGLMDKLGVERRLYTAGKNKDMLDPFSPQRPQDVTYIKGLLQKIHQQFIAEVKKGRGDRLADNPDLFSGLVWTGADSVKLGLADGLGDTGYVARDVIKAKRTVDYTVEPDVLARLAHRFGASFAHSLKEAMDSVRLR